MSVATIAPEFLASERLALGEDLYAREYLCQFAKASAALFTIDRLAGLIETAA